MYLLCLLILLFENGLIFRWLFPFVGHMGIALSSGIIRDFAGPYYVSEDDMAFGWPTKYWQLSPNLARGGQNGFDRSVTEASEVYKTRMVIISFYSLSLYN